MDIEKLKTFRTFVESGCDVNCCVLLGLTRAGVWGQISALEKSLKIELVNRRKQHNSLTEAGQVLFKNASLILQSNEKVIEAYEKALREMQSGYVP